MAFSSTAPPHDLQLYVIFMFPFVVNSDTGDFLNPSCGYENFPLHANFQADSATLAHAALLNQPENSRCPETLIRQIGFWTVSQGFGLNFRVRKTLSPVFLYLP